MTRVTSTIFLLLFISATSLAQDRYMVFFKDKANSPYSVTNPQAFLSQRSLARRLKNNVLVSEEDLPVNQSYIDQVAGLGIETYFSTKWMNGVLVQMQSSQVGEVESLDIVESVEYVAPGDILTPIPFGRAKFTDSPIEPSRIVERQFQMLELDLMHEANFMGNGVMVAILDDGFQNYTSLPAFQHAVLSNRISYTFDFTRNRPDVDNSFNHGLRVMSLIAANTFDIIGGVPNAEYFLAVTEAPGEYRVEEYNWLFAAEKADSAGVDVINTSLGYNDSFQDDSMDYSVADMDGNTAVITRASNIAASKGIVLVTSSGNSGDDAWRIITAPADSEHVLTVGAVDAGGTLSGFSSVGPSADARIKPDVVAQGVGTRLLTSSGAIGFQNGTSFSAPLVTCLAAGLIEAFPEMAASEIRDIIKRSGNMADEPNNLFGYGIPGFMRASRIANEALIPIENGIITYPNPTDLPYFTVAFEEDLVGTSINAQLLTSEGSVVRDYNFRPNLFYNRFQIDLTGVTSGLLILKLVTPSGVVTKKIIKAQ
ncbi:S8 family serine peptidase [Roseivirga sp. E12]|uniref:S8 family serine peptidase n=1 Tax=Roseivirga sp. E12 TaxID=2819237 RepID=UPI001ABBF673|nr:S8 family serine peptidase [Roseivirga sp. E12]MBO3697314.1 S8 family peptidase [Roseivirga sp. E12]